MRPYADHDAYDVWTDAVATGDFDPDGLMPARLPGRPNHFQTSRRPLSRRDPVAPPSWRSSEATTHGPPDDGSPHPPSSGPVAFFEREE